jgi:hypothetical protein
MSLAARAGVTPSAHHHLHGQGGIRDTAQAAGFEKALMGDLAKSAYRFTPTVKASFLAFRKAEALEALAGHGISLPSDLLAWIDETPDVAATVYGLRYGTPAQALILLRSLQLDLTLADMQAHSPVVLATVVMHAHKIDLAEPEALPYVSLKPREPMPWKIPASPLVRVDTHPKDRPLDISDHVINFMEEEEVVEGGKVVSVKPREPHIRACDIVASKALQADFNAYVQSKVPDFKPLDCGESLNWAYGGVSWRLPERKELGRAYELFSEAYFSKGRIPKARDPKATPVEWAAYQVGNAKNENRKAELPDTWPFAMYLVNRPQPLREAEFAWEEKAKGVRPMRYIEYVGKVAQDTTMLYLRRMTPFEYAYGSLAMMRKDGGVCGTHTSTALRAGASLGKMVINCSSPGHSFPGGLGKQDGVYSAPGSQTGVKWYFGDSEPKVIGRDSLMLPSLAAALNWGLQGFLDSQLGWTLCLQLPEDVQAAHGYTLLKSALLQNPYNVSLARATLAKADTADALITLWEEFRGAVHAAKEKKGCIQEGGLVAEVWQKAGEKLEGLPVPKDRVVRDRVYTAVCRDGSSPKLRARYEGAVNGIDAVLMSATRDFAAHLDTWYRPVANCAATAGKLKAALDMVDGADRKRTWIKAQVDTLAGRGLCLSSTKRGYQVVQDEAAALVMQQAGVSSDETAWMTVLLDQTTAALEKHLTLPRSTPGCKDMAARLRGVVSSAKEREIDLTPWAGRWYSMMDGKQAYARHAWCQKDAASVVLDELKAEYPGAAGQRAELVAMEKKYRALKEELHQLNGNLAGGKNQDRVNEINGELDKLAEQIKAAKATYNPGA